MHEEITLATQAVRPTVVALEREVVRNPLLVEELHRQRPAEHHAAGFTRRERLREDSAFGEHLPLAQEAPHPVDAEAQRDLDRVVAEGLVEAVVAPRERLLHLEAEAHQVPFPGPLPAGRGMTSRSTISPFATASAIASTSSSVTLPYTT